MLTFSLSESADPQRTRSFVIAGCVSREQSSAGFLREKGNEIC